MKNITLKLIVALSFLWLLSSCEEQTETSYVFNEISGPSNLNARIEMVNPDTNEISVTLSGENASSFDVYFGDTDNETPTVASPGETLNKVYAEEGEYILRAVAKTLSGATSELSRNIIIGGGGVTVDPPTEGPQEPAPTPTIAEADVISLFSDNYDDVTVDTWRTDWSSAVLEDINIADNPVKKYSDLDFVGVETVANQIDASGMSHIHLDVWTDNTEEFKIKLVDFGADGAFDGGDDSEHELVFDNLTASEWNSLDIELTDFVGLNSLVNLSQYIFAATPTGSSIIYLDNIYFYSAPTAVVLPALPINFESSEISYNPFPFGNATAAVIPNPDTTGNESANVLEVFKPEGAEDWAGVFMELDAPIDFSTTTLFKVKVWSPEAGARIILKIENSANGDIKAEVDALTTVASAWEELTFDMSASTENALDMANAYDKLVLFPNFGAGNNLTYYFDDIEQYVQLPELPIDFESSEISYDPFPFGNATAAVIANPDTVGNESASVLEVFKPDGAEEWAGVFMVLDAPIDFSTTTLFSVKVWSPEVGARIILKIENSTNGDIKAEIDALTTVASAWEELTFDMSASTENPLDMANAYDKLVLFPNFGAGNNLTYYFDDIMLNE